jgi:glycosyltransferase involved in cell wall biosynthesis
MRIAQVAPLYEKVPPPLYGGSERVVSWLNDELIRKGHEVTLFASGDSTTKGRLIAPCQRSLRSDKNAIDKIAPYVLMVEKVSQMANEFDIVHSHADYWLYPLARRLNIPVVTTCHGRMDLAQNLYAEFPDVPLVSISEAQRKPIPWANWQATIYHGLPTDLYQFKEKPGKYLAFLGRPNEEKGVLPAIRIAKAVGMPLIIAGKVDAADDQYFSRVVEPYLSDPDIQYIGEVDDAGKNELLGNAYALLFPINLPESFGLVMIESMACGTPVVAFECGSVPEVIQNGENGFKCRTIDEGIEAVKRISEINRLTCRRIFEERFSVGKMADQYIALYQRLRSVSRLLYAV